METFAIFFPSERQGNEKQMLSYHVASYVDHWLLVSATITFIIREDSVLAYSLPWDKGSWYFGLHSLIDGSKGR